MSSSQFVTFRIRESLFGLPILKVREINRLLDITPIHHAPVYVRGLMNLRGQTVTIFDLGIRLGIGPREITHETHNIILKEDVVGLIVDCIGDVEEVDDTALEAPPSNLQGIRKEFIEGVAKLKDELLVILSSREILSFTSLRLQTE